MAQALQTGRARYDGLDILKAISAFFVVGIHCRWEGFLWPIFSSLGQAAPMIFLMVTGFFYTDTRRKGRTGAQIKKLLRLLVGSLLLFVVWNLAWLALYDRLYATRKLGEFFAALCTPREWLEFLFLNEAQPAGHLWYLGAILYVLVLAWLAEKLPQTWRKGLYGLVPLLLLANLVLGEFLPMITGTPLPSMVFRNFLLNGLPFFCLGMFVRRLNDAGRLPTARRLGVFSLVLLVAMLAEAIVFAQAFPTLPGPNLLVCKLLLIPVVFAFFLRAYENRTLSGVERVAARWGLLYSTTVYIVHPIFIDVCHAGVNVVAKVLHWPALETVYPYVASVVVFACTLVFALLWAKVQNRLFPKKRS